MFISIFKNKNKCLGINIKKCFILLIPGENYYFEWNSLKQYYYFTSAYISYTTIQKSPISL